MAMSISPSLYLSIAISLYCYISLSLYLSISLSPGTRSLSHHSAQCGGDGLSPPSWRLRSASENRRGAGTVYVVQYSTVQYSTDWEDWQSFILH